MIKNRFFCDIEKFGGFFCFWSIMEIYVIDYIPVQLAYLGKIWFLRYGPKRSRLMRVQDYGINYTLLYKLHFHKQRHAETDKKLSKC